LSHLARSLHISRFSISTQIQPAILDLRLSCIFQKMPINMIAQTNPQKKSGAYKEAAAF
jgi:deoxycytidine triphosphate deaminase